MFSRLNFPRHRTTMRVIQHIKETLKADKVFNLETMTAPASSIINSEDNSIKERTIHVIDSDLISNPLGCQTQKHFLKQL